MTSVRTGPGVPGVDMVTGDGDQVTGAACCDLVITIMIIMTRIMTPDTM